MTNITDNVDVKKIDISIQMLNEYVKEESVEPLISVLEALKKDPDNESLIVQLSDVWNGLGITQGAVLTYAPYVHIMIGGDIFGDDE